jgi:N-acetylglucosamine malate deacetylase 1
MNRRQMLKGAGLVTGVAAASAVAQNPNTGRKYKIVVTGGHPGDPEYGCGGTIARLRHGT